MSGRHRFAAVLEIGHHLREAGAVARVERILQRIGFQPADIDHRMLDVGQRHWPLRQQQRELVDFLLRRQ